MQQHTLDNTIWDPSLLTKMRQVDHQLDWIHIMCNNHQLGLLVLNQPNTMIQSLLDHNRLITNFAILLALLGNDFSLLDETGFLFLRRFGTVLVQKFEQRGSGVLVENIGELGEGRRNLETFFEDFLLALETDVLRPFNITGQVLLRLDIPTDAKVLRTLLDEGVLCLFGGLVCGGEGRRGNLFLRSLYCISLGLQLGDEDGSTICCRFGSWVDGDTALVRLPMRKQSQIAGLRVMVSPK